MRRFQYSYLSAKALYLLDLQIVLDYFLAHMSNTKLAYLTLRCATFFASGFLAILNQAGWSRSRSYIYSTPLSTMINLLFFICSRLPKYIGWATLAIPRSC